MEHIGRIQDMSVLWPAAVGKEEDYVLFKSGTPACRKNDIEEQETDTKE